MGGKSNAHKKRRISKHIREAQARKKQQEAEDASTIAKNGGEAPTLPSTNNKNPVKKQNKNIKDPKEAQNYLSMWKYKDSSPGMWKFNKNTQSWICRHMYDTEKIPKSSFDILVEYLKDLKGSMRKVVNDEAVRRALRYKEWEKENKDKKDEEEDNDGGNESKSDGKEADEEVKADHQKFRALSDHDKRKEYKRSRKIIDLFKNEIQEES